MNTLRENRGVKDENMRAVEGERGDGVDLKAFSLFLLFRSLTDEVPTCDRRS